MNLFAKSGFAVLVGLAFSLTYVGCTKPSSTASESADRPGYADRSTSTVSADDKDFAIKAAQGGMAEVELGKLAQERGAIAHVKDYGKMLVDDHTRLNNDLKDIAAKENITLPTAVNPGQRRNIDRFAKLSGSPLLHALEDEVDSVSVGLLQTA
jgi:putative membrane protein